MNNKRKKLLAIGGIIIVVIVTGIILSKEYNEKQYEKTLIQTSENLISLGVDAEKVTNNYISLWNGIIEYKSGSEWTRPYMANWIGIDQNDFVNNTSPLEFSDRAIGFNDVLQCYKNYNVNKGVDKDFSNRMNNIEKSISELNNPPSKFKASYNALVDMYTNMNSFIGLAVEPSGSLVSYRNSTGELDSKIISNYNIFKTQLPKKN